MKHIFSVHATLYGLGAVLVSLAIVLASLSGYVLANGYIVTGITVTMGILIVITIGFTETLTLIRQKINRTTRSTECIHQIRFILLENKRQELTDASALSEIKRAANKGTVN